nr:zinc finger BED domain-containing protein RICESLEEPER 2 [Tanacetum cinerariifolium]
VKDRQEKDKIGSKPDKKGKRVESARSEPKQVPQDTKPILITIIRPITKPAPDIEMIRSSSRRQIIDTILEVQIPKPKTGIIRSSSQPTGPVIDVTPPEQPESPQAAPKADRGKGTARDTNESPPKLVKASTKAHLDKEEKQKKATKEARLLEMNKFELIKKAELNVLNKERPEKLIEAKELRKKRIDQYRWTTSSRLKPKTITNIHIHLNTKPIIITVYIGNDRRNFEVNNPFRIGDFRVTEWDKLGPVIKKKKNKVFGELMTSLGKKYHRLKVIPRKIGITPSLLTPRQALYPALGRNRMAHESPEVCILGLECNRSLPEGVSFVNNLVTKQPKNGLFFIDVFGNEAFQRMNNIYKVDVDTLLTYLMMYLNVSTPTNQRNHITHPHCEVIKAQKNQNSKAGKRRYDPDYLREQFAGLVIQRAFPFNHFHHEQTTRVFQNTMQPRYTHAMNDPTMSSEFERYVNSDFVTHLHPKEFATFDVLGFWKEKETMFPVLSRMAMDLISVQASSVASESAFSTSGRVLSIRRIRLTPASLEMCMCLKDHLDAKEHKQNKCPLEIPLDFEEDVLDDEVQRNEAILLSDEEIALDASSEGTLSPRGLRYDYMMSSEAEDDY